MSGEIEGPAEHSFYFYMINLLVWSIGLFYRFEDVCVIFSGLWTLYWLPADTGDVYPPASGIKFLSAYLIISFTSKTPKNNDFSDRKNTE